MMRGLGNHLVDMHGQLRCTCQPQLQMAGPAHQRGACWLCLIKPSHKSRLCLDLPCSFKGRQGFGDFANTDNLSKAGTKPTSDPPKSQGSELSQCEDHNTVRVCPHGALMVDSSHT